MGKTRLSAHNLTDEEVLKEFMSRFQCDGAVLIYLDSNTESGFGRWRTREGRKWVKTIFKSVNPANTVVEETGKGRKGVTLPVSIM